MPTPTGIQRAAPHWESIREKFSTNTVIAIARLKRWRLPATLSWPIEPEWL